MLSSLRVERAHNWNMPEFTDAPQPPHHDATMLDNAAWHALVEGHARFAEGDALVRRYPADVAPFIAAQNWEDARVWDSVVDLVGHETNIVLFGGPPAVPDGWEALWRIDGVQLVETAALQPVPDAEALLLGEADVPEMLALVARNEPGPFMPRTHELGRYGGFRRDGQLVAMAGERLRLDGWAEISAVSTDDAYRRQGLASRLVLDVAFHIQQRGDRAFMHAAATNVGAIAAYERLGFARRAHTEFTGVRVP